MAGNLIFPIRSNKLAYSVEYSAHLLHSQTKFQTIDIYDTPVFGKVLLLDGHIQLAALDEMAYHEALVHIPMLSIAGPARALVIGGGDGGVLRELCKHKSLENVVMVEIDGEVIATCKEHLPEVSAGAFEDARVSVQIEDAFIFVNNATDKYDLIVMDVTDVYEEESGELSERLFTDEFYADIRALLNDGGFLVTQADNSVFCPYSMKAVLEGFKKTYRNVGSYQALVPSFGGFSGYCWASIDNEVSTSMPANDLKLSYLNEATYALAMTRLPFHNGAG